MEQPLHRFGTHFIVGLASTALSAEEARLFETLRPAGVIIFRHNIAARDHWPEELSALINAARKHSGRDKFFVSIDHEGGKVHRLPAPVTRFPPANCWGSMSYDVAAAHARELRALGINLSFAPVLDVLSDPDNTVIGPRAFSTDPRAVARCALEYYHGLRDGGIMACGKHFPGHGGTKADSHFELPRCPSTKDELQHCELPPFIALIQAGIRLLMTAHVVYPELDPKLPATVSGKIINGLLRSELGYKQAVISDALEMGAMSGIDHKLIGKMFLEAGGDLLLVGQPSGALPIRRALEMAEALQTKPPAEALLQSSASRVEELFRVLPANGARLDTSLLGCAAHKALYDKLQITV